MKTLDRYIIRQFLLNFGILLTVLITLFVVIDLIVDLDEFTQAGEAFADDYVGGRWVATLATIVDYYTPTVLLVYVFFNGLVVVGAMGFTLTALQRSRELTAMIASGVSLYRVAAPLVVTGLALSALTLPVQEFVLPPLAGKLVRKKSELKRDRGGQELRPVFYAPAGGNDLLSAREFDPEAGVLRGVQIHARTADGQTARFVRAREAFWRDRPGAGGGASGAAAAAGNGQWQFLDGVAEEVRRPGDPDSGRRRAVEAYDTDLSPTLLRARQTALYANLLSIRELQDLAGNRAVDARRRGRITQTIWSRFSLMVLNGLLLLMALPFFLTRNPGSTLISALRAAGLCIGAWGGGLVMLQLGPDSVPLAALARPAVVAWLPVVIYLPVAAWQLGRIRT